MNLLDFIKDNRLSISEIERECKLSKGIIRTDRPIPKKHYDIIKSYLAKAGYFSDKIPENVVNVVTTNDDDKFNDIATESKEVEQNVVNDKCQKIRGLDENDKPDKITTKYNNFPENYKGKTIESFQDKIHRYRDDLGLWRRANETDLKGMQDDINEDIYGFYNLNGAGIKIYFEYKPHPITPREKQILAGYLKGRMKLAEHQGTTPNLKMSLNCSGNIKMS